MGVLVSLSVCHCCNDTLQAVVNSLYPIIKDDLALNFVQIGIITLIYQMSASVLQPIMGFYLDRRPNPWFLTLAACLTFTGMVFLAYANTIGLVILSVVLVGAGSSIVHPEASRLTSLASGGRKGFAQSIFQVGGNFGGSLGPLLAALVIAPYGRNHTALVAFVAFIGIGASILIAGWYKKLLAEADKKAMAEIGTNAAGMSSETNCAANVDVVAEAAPRKHKVVHKGDPDWIPRPYSDQKTYFVIGVLLLLIFSKYVYMASMSSYYTFYLIDKFGVSIQNSQYALFIFTFATALGTMLGGPIGDKIGRKYVIWASILGTAPFSIAMPFANLEWTIVFSFGVGFMLSSAFPAIIIYAQELLPNRLGMISGLFFGFSFGIAGIAAAFWGGYAESHGIEAVFHLSAYLPLLGIVAVLLPKR
ncbi:MAG: MFS transporter [Bacteroidales bacterium]